MRRPASYSTSGATSNWTSGAYAYDGAGNVTAIGSNSYLYDPVSRLTSASQWTGAAAGTGSLATQDAAYDPYGNITTLTTNGSGLTLSTSTSSNRLGSASYDSAGSMTWWNNNTYAYEPLGMTRNITASGVETVHVYTADDERVWTFQPGAPSRWTIRDLDGTVLREFKNNAGTWSVERDYVYRDGALLAASTPAEVLHYHPDHLGSPRLITGTNGMTRAYHLYHPYGAEATAFNQDTERLKFTAHERDLGNLSSAADDIDYMHARFYQPQVGRFLGVDPIKRGVLQDVQLHNRYSYAVGNPLRYVDPDGKDIQVASGAGSKTVMKLLIVSAMRPTSRAILQRIADNRGFVLALRAEAIPGNRLQAQLARSGRKATMTFGDTTPRVRVDAAGVKTVGADVRLDLGAIRGFHPDRTGIRTFNHEVYHASDFEQGKSMEEVRKGDLPDNESGPAAQFGMEIENELPDLSEEEARALVRAWVQSRTGHQ